MDCQRCRKHGVSWTSDMVQLLGGVQAHLCVDCLNEWRMMIEEKPERKELRATDVKEAHLSARAIARDVPSREEYAELAAERDDILRRIALIGLEFIKPLVPVASDQE